MIEFSQFWGWFYLTFFITAIPMAFFIVLEKRSPFKTAAWILTLLLIPILGVIFYLFFGQEYRKQKMFSRRGLKGLGLLRQLTTLQLRKIDQTPPLPGDPVHDFQKIIRLLLKNESALLTTGNQVKLLRNGADTFDAIFEAIKRARHHIHLEYYIFEKDKIGKKLLALLLQKHEEGVEVRIIVDDVGSWGLSKRFMKRLRKKGVSIEPFLEVRFPRLTSRMNYRNHRKIVVIDGEIGFIGGVNVADRYIEGMPKIGHWADTHLEIRGDAAASLQILFAVDWFFLTRKSLLGEPYFPLVQGGRGIPIQISASGPDHDWETIAQAFFMAIVNAEKRVYIVTPYLMPPDSMITALQTAALSNVDVRIIIPKRADSRLSKWCSFSYIEKLLEAGVRIFLYQDGFVHSKYMLVDDGFATVGSSNFDYRSFETNFEANAFLYSREFCKELESHYLENESHCTEIKLDEWQRRPWLFKVKEALAHMISPMF